MEFTAKQIAELLQGTVDGNAEAKVSRLSKIEEGTEGSLTFLANPAYTQFIYTTNASVAIVNSDFVAEKE
ncbi:MAG TPA: LpxD N-terminal domain-containing protein, partial [Bacteroidia bacterium]|nr:LpxD N-terminal domain-containing protein [Bacteroidia bacterium]